MAFSKNSVLKIVNPLLAVIAATQLVTMVLFTFFEESIPFPQVHTIHVWGGYFLFCIIVLHIFLNWPWIKTTYFKKKKKL
jgi:hypothetical protein